MPTAMEDLVDFIRKRRALLGMSHNALARAAGLHPGTLANLMVGRIKNSPSLGTLRKIAAALQVDPLLLIRMASGQPVETIPPAPKSTSKVPAGYPLTSQEEHLLDQAREVGLFWHLEEPPGVLEIPPSERIWLFRQLDAVRQAILLQVHLAAVNPDCARILASPSASRFAHPTGPRRR
ncbi:MAG: helix-turn-helix transcriptional regulator [Cyanobacteria bacterium REEB65]|nr:helix-turn-helix transcriptional regulator [Cyanobacteria bacterium REEB65]